MKTFDQNGAPPDAGGDRDAMAFASAANRACFRGRGRAGFRAARAWMALGLVGGVWMGQCGAAKAQETSELITTQLPFPPYVPIQEDHYGLRIGKVQVRYDISVENTFTDNRNYSNDNREWDYGLRPLLTVGLFHPFSDRQKVQLDVSLGYQWWANVSEQNRFYIAPRSHISYVVGVGNVDLSIVNTSSSTSEASSRIEIAGGADANGGTDLAFNRINNTTSLGAGWRPGRVGFSGNYSFYLDRSLTDQFTSLDQNRHTFGGSTKFYVTAPITVGLAGNYSIYQYLEQVQNDGTGFSITPTLEWRLRDNLSLEASAGYGQSDFDRTGTIQDDEGFSGITYDVAIRHQINKRMNHSLQFSRGADPGLNSNFTDRFIINYSLSSQIGPALRPYVGFLYQSASTSGVDSEDADQFRVNFGVGYPILRRASLGLNYSVVWRVADDPNREYLENRVSLTASYRF